MNFDSDITIIGGALNGSTLAIALASVGLSVTLVDPVSPEKQARDDFDGRGYALALTSMRMLNVLGLWADIADKAQPMTEIKVSDGRAGQGASPFVLEFDHAEIGQGPLGYMIEDRYLRRSLFNALTQNPLISIISNDSVLSHRVETGFATATLTGGRIVKSRLLVGCDGRKSATARRASIPRTGWEYGQTALVCAIDHERAHNGIAHQFFMPPGPLAILPLPGNRSSIVWSESHKEAARVNTLNDEDYLDVLRPRFGDFLGQISLAGQRFSYPLGLSIATSFIAERVALVGDAAHGMHPIAGQGLNAGLKDIAALAEVLRDAARRGEDIGRGDVLDRYQQWRRFDISTLALATDSFNRLFSNDNSLLRVGRDLGMGFVNSIPGLRRQFMKEAAGLSGDLPKLLQGIAL